MKDEHRLKNLPMTIEGEGVSRQQSSEPTGCTARRHLYITSLILIHDFFARDPSFAAILINNGS
jgi:hypothetical protein